MCAAFALWQLPSVLGVTSPVQHGTKHSIFDEKKKYTHGTASGGFLKLFKGK